MDQAVKKQALRLFTYGLYIVTCVDRGQENGFTANWLMQVSFEPPMVAVSIENDAKSLPMIERSGKFAINVLKSGEEGRKLAGQLGKSAYKQPDKMKMVAHEMGEDGLPILRDALGWVVCRVRKNIDTGDSTLIVGEVVNAGIIEEGQPLTMLEAGFKHAG